MASHAVASIVPQTTALLSGEPSSVDDVAQGLVAVNATADSPPLVGADSKIAEQTMHTKGLVEKQRVQMPFEADSPNASTSKQNTNKEGSMGITKEVQGIDEQYDASANSDVDMMDQVENVHTSPESNKDINMLDKYAFDFDGNAYDHHVPLEFTNTTVLYIGRLHPQSTSLEEHRQQAEANNEVDICPPLIPDQNEMNSDMKTWDGRKAIECVWVGMIPAWNKQNKTDSAALQPQPPTVEDGERKMHRKFKKSIRIVDLTPDNMEVTSYDPNALRVVAKRSNKATKNWFLYALLSPDPVTKLCQGWRVGFDEVFYFRAFRGDKKKSYMPRKQVTQEKIRELIFPNDLSQAKQSGSLFLPPTTGKSSTQKSKQPVSKKSGNATSNAGGVQSQDANSTDNHNVQNPVLTIKGDDDPVGDQELMAGFEANDFGKVDFNKEKDPVDNDEIMAVIDDEDLNQVDSNNADSPEFDATVGVMMQNVDYAESNIGKEKVEQANKTEAKGENVSFKNVNNKVANMRGKVINTPTKSRHRDDDLDTSIGSQGDIDSLTIKMINQIMKMTRKKDLAALRQGHIMLKCMEKRCVSPITSALGLYLNVPIGEDGHPDACVKKLREVMDLFPELENIDINNYTLAWMTRGLQITRQSIDMELLPYYLICFSDLFNNQFKDTPNEKIRFRRCEITDMICQARDDAEKMMDVGFSSGNDHDEKEEEEKKKKKKKTGSLKRPNHPSAKELSKISKRNKWSNPSDDPAPKGEDEDEDAESEGQE
ncbi:hypothetical protein VM1G_06492 [Cytospora mali]|uniref:Uncharacterized protein n=1 Tax=Cytospora mali TaxID=578113 RepID=A0A194W2V9_CYTMA|nr:hypothetical protein VM1G_06492 [Valsa mali]